MIIFDIETGGLPEDQIEIPEFEAPSNYKTAEAINKYILKKRQEYIERAAISAITGEVLAIGYQRFRGDIQTEIELIHSKSESDMIQEFWNLLNEDADELVVGWNSNGFDMPFMIRRSWKLGITPPRFLSEYGRPLNRFIDLMKVWGCGSNEMTKLDTVAKYLGVGAKNGDGKYFKEMYLEDKEKALDYLRNDVDMTVKVAAKLECILK